MANWKKMAEAFGRAMKDPGASREGKDLVKKAVTIDDGMPDLGERLERDVAYTKGRRDANSENLDDLSKSLDERQARFDERSEERTDKALEENRQKEWDDAFASAKERVKRDYGDDYPKDMAAEGADTFESQLWDVIDELKARGRSADDILGALKSMGEK